MRLVTRRKWGARAPKHTPDRNPIGPGSTLFIHWSDSSGRSIDTKREQRATIQGIQNFHMDSRGWNDIAYSYIVFQPFGILRRVRVFAGRGFGSIPAAQESHNTGNGAVCVVMAAGDPLNWRTKRKLRAIFRRFPGRTLRGHRDVNQTSCPGDKLYAALPEIRRGDPSKKTSLP